MKVIKTSQQERFCCRLIHTAVPFNIEQKWLRVSQRNCPPCIERGSDVCFREDPWFFYSTTACKFMLYFLTTGSPLRNRILCIYTIFIHGQSFISTPTGHIIISSHIKTIEQINVTIKYRYILKLMIGSGPKDYHPGETILKLSRYTKVVGILDEICLMFRRGPLPRRWLLDDFLRRHYTRLPCVVSVVLKITGSWAVVAKPLNSIPYEIFSSFPG